jgi:hypothetical protein
MIIEIEGLQFPAASIPTVEVVGDTRRLPVKHAGAIVLCGATVPYPPGTSNYHSRSSVDVGRDLFEARIWRFERELSSSLDPHGMPTQVSSSTGGLADYSLSRTGIATTVTRPDRHGIHCNTLN